MEKIKNILLIDPLCDKENIIYRLIRLSLGKRINITIADTAKKGLIALGKNKPDLLIMEYHLGEDTAEYILAEMNDNKLLKDIPTIVTTEKVDELAAVQSIKYGAHEYISKTFVCESTLLDTIEKAMVRVETEAKKQLFHDMDEDDQFNTLNKLKALTTRISLLTNKVRIAHHLYNYHNLEESLAQLSNTIVELDKHTDSLFEEKEVN